MLESSAPSLTAEEMDAKRKARIEKFGAAEVEEAQRSANERSSSGFKMNRRKIKMMHKKEGGKRTIMVGGGDKNRHKSGGKMHKRFKKGQ